MTKMRQMVQTLLPGMRGAALTKGAQPQPEMQPVRKTALMTSRKPAAHKPKSPRHDHASNM